MLHTPELLFGRLAVAVSFAPFNIQSLQYFLLPILHNFLVNFATIVFFRAIHILCLPIHDYQISYGDIILLNKTDLVPETKVNELKDVIRDVKAGARLLHSQYGKVPLPLILDVGFSQTELFAFAKDSSHPHHHNEHHHCDHLANDGFISVSFQSDRSFSVVKFQKFLEDLNENIFRAKGIIWFKESNLRHIFPLSGKRIELQADQWQQKRSNQFVFIGRNLNAAQLQEQLTNCLI
ncbi:CobW family GTP-binding protein [Chlorogloea sp. CCALA 695]|uniref:CobW family GTP-binding protein n=1 Tax=Chlorogloea sp. CCALA 695 TaxID=2107693 RepID=UPI0018EBD667|nr:GTP-binding protein [Chlorogloea sp. CCALA 695]